MQILYSKMMSYFEKFILVCDSDVEKVSEREDNAVDDQVANSSEEKSEVELFTALEIGFTSHAT